MRDLCPLKLDDAHVVALALAYVVLDIATVRCRGVDRRDLVPLLAVVAVVLLEDGLEVQVGRVVRVALARALVLVVGLREDGLELVRHALRHQLRQRGRRNRSTQT